jgi:hypothetical protein
VGICEGGSSSQEDVEMDVVGAAQARRRIITGSAELCFKRDRMEIQPLIQGDGIRKI